MNGSAYTRSRYNPRQQNIQASTSRIHLESIAPGMGGEDILRSKIIHKDRRALRHGDHGIPLNLRIRRQHPLRQTRHDALRKIEILPSTVRQHVLYYEGVGKGEREPRGVQFAKRRTSILTPVGTSLAAGSSSLLLPAFEASLFLGGIFAIGAWGGLRMEGGRW